MLQQGDIIWFDFADASGHEVKGRRPGVVVSNDIYNESSSLVAICFISNTKSDFPYYVKLDECCNTTGKVLCDHIRVIDAIERNFKVVERIPRDTLSEVLGLVVSLFR